MNEIWDQHATKQQTKERSYGGWGLSWYTCWNCEQKSKTWEWISESKLEEKFPGCGIKVKQHIESAMRG
jgi:hypothetical protein